MKKLVFFGITHGAFLAVGFALGIYMLPILTAPKGPDTSSLEKAASSAMFTAAFKRELRGSDFLHWGEGSVSVSPEKMSHMGKLAPGPDYMLYLTKDFVEHEEEFLPIKKDAQLIGPVKTFNGFLLDIPAGVNLADYTTVVVWCESFGEFITAAKYR